MIDGWVRPNSLLTGARVWPWSGDALAQLNAPTTVNTTVSAARHPLTIDAPFRDVIPLTLACAHWFRGTGIGDVASEHREGGRRCANGSTSATDRLWLGGAESRRDGRSTVRSLRSDLEFADELSDELLDDLDDHLDNSR